MSRTLHPCALALILLLAFLPFGCASDDDGDPAPNDGDAETETAPDGDISEEEATPEEEEENAEGDAESEEETDTRYREVFEVRTQTGAVSDDPTPEEIPTLYRTPAQLADLNVTAVAYVGTDLYVGTGAGLFKLNPATDLFEPILLPAPESPAVKDASPEGIVAIAGERFNDRLLIGLPSRAIFLGETSLQLPITGRTLTSVAVTGSYAAIGTTNGALLGHIQSSFDECAALTGIEVRGVAVDDQGVLYAATAQGVMVVAEDALRETWNVVGAGVVDDDVKGVSFCGSGRVAAASAQGLSIHDGEAVTLVMTRADTTPALPTDGLLNIDCSPAGLLIGHAIGATFFSPDLSHRDYYYSQRYLPDNRAAAVSLGAVRPTDGQAPTVDRLIGTPAGLSRIQVVYRTLAEKERLFDAQTDLYWRMDGFFGSDGWSEDPWDTDGPYTIPDFDNDGLWTQMMIGGWCMAYAATGDERYYQKARRAMDNMLLLVDVPAVSFEAAGLKRGFITRSLVRDDEGDLFQSKSTQTNWHRVDHEGRQYYWKDDTSSDETTGHFFGFPVFYDLCAKTDEERAEIAERASSLMRYIIEGGYLLIDLDGQRTAHGHWDPDTISIAVDGLSACLHNGYDINECGDAMGGGGWLNATEILGHLLATWHMTGDPLFYEEYERLISEHRYDEMVLPNEYTYTITSPSIANHSDHELAMLAYTTLLRYDPNPERRARWQEGLAFLYRYELPERNPWWAGVAALSGLESPDALSSRRTLHEMPADLRSWGYDNSHRKDAVERSKDRHQGRQFDRVFPYDEIRTFWWNGNPYAMIEGGDGRGRGGPCAWLLAYYINLYSGLIVP